MNSLKPSRLSKCDLHCLDKIWPLRLPLHTIRANIFRTRKIFPVSNTDALPGFLALCETDYETFSSYQEKLPANQRAQNQTAIQTTLPPPAAPPPLAAIFNALKKLRQRSSIIIVILNVLGKKVQRSSIIIHFFNLEPETLIFNKIPSGAPATDSSRIHPAQKKFNQGENEHQSLYT